MNGRPWNSVHDHHLRHAVEEDIADRGHVVVVAAHLAASTKADVVEGHWS